MNNSLGGLLFTQPGRIIVVSLVISIVGIVCCGIAGRLKEKADQLRYPEKAQEIFTGKWVAYRYRRWGRASMWTSGAGGIILLVVSILLIGWGNRPAASKHSITTAVL